MLTLLASLALAAPPGDLPGEHARQAAAHPGERHPGQHQGPIPLPDATPGPQVKVYGYQAYWSDDLSKVQWDQLSHIAIFNAEADSSGNLSNTSRWDIAPEAVALAEPYGVKVHLCVTNFSSSSIGSLVGSPSARGRLIDSLVDAVDESGADGVNIDFEGLPSSAKQDMVDFVEELDAAVDEVVLATPAVDWSGAWDYSELSKHADLFIMAYGYHWGGSTYAGPVDPLFGGGDWDDHAIDWTLDDYLANGADPARVILGLPLYGYSWPVAGGSVPTETTGDGSAVFWDEAQAGASENGRQWDADSATPYYDDGGRQIWYGDTDSLRQRIQYSNERGIGGVGFWALHYDDDDATVWSMIDEETNPAAPPPPPDDPPAGDYVADAGQPFLAYVGDTVKLNGTDSIGPDGVDLRYRWTQVAGPRVALSSETSARPEFVVEAPGTTAFELVVGDGTTFSPPVRSYVVVLDPEGGKRHLPGGCDSTGAPASTPFAAVAAAATLAALARRLRQPG